MADEREGEEIGPESPARRDKIQTAGREANDAQPLNAAKDHGGPERYPSVRQDDAAERTGRGGEAGEPRSFGTGGANPEPRQGAGDSTLPRAANEGRLGPGGDPVEGKR